MILSFQIFILCVFGTILTIKSSEFARKLYDIDWTDLKVSDRKIFGIILLRANMNIHMSYIVGVLDFESFVSVSVASSELSLKFNNSKSILQIYQKISSFFMMLINFSNWIQFHRVPIKAHGITSLCRLWGKVLFVELEIRFYEWKLNKSEINKILFINILSMS